MSEEKKILIIDDEEVIHISLNRILSKQGFHVDSAMTTHEAFEKLKRESYDLLITDLMMPEMNGVQFLEELGKKSITIPSIMITGYPTIRTAVQALRLGAVDYIPKPFTRQEILSPVCRALRRDCSDFDKNLDFSDKKKEASMEPSSVENIVVMPGERFVLPEHSWAQYQKDGTVLVGVMDSFIKSAGKIQKVEVPIENDLVEQGYVAITITTENGEVHNVFSPISGRIMEVNTKALDPQNMDNTQWVMRVLPSQLKQDIAMLIKQPDQS